MTGFVLGKFMPLHAGHQRLLDAACRRVGEANVTVLIETLADHPIPGAWRVEWLKERYPQARVVCLTERLPQLPHEHPRFWEIWREAILRYVGAAPDVVFAGEDYGAELARTLGASFERVDRAALPVSGTLVREDPFSQWAHLAPCVRPYFVRRVVVFGPESTGKTILAQRLAAYFKTVWVPEFARGYIDAKGVPASGPPCTYSDIEAIAQGQLTSEDRLAREANKLLICDTDLLTTRIYSEEFFKKCPELVVRAAQERRYDLYVLTRDDVPFAYDAQRDRARWKSGFNAIFRKRLIEKGAAFVEVGGGWEERFQAACRAVEVLLACHPPCVG